MPFSPAHTKTNSISKEAFKVGHVPKTPSMALSTAVATDSSNFKCSPRVMENQRYDLPS